MGSHDALLKIESTEPDWAAMLRPAANKAIVVVTDDEADPSPGAAGFSTYCDTTFGAGRWMFSGVFCTPQVSANCANVGLTYQALVDQTSGVTADMATGVDASKLDAIAAGIVARAGCH